MTFLEDLLERFGGGDEAQETLLELAHHSADSGWPGITYYRDTVAMYEKHTDEIWDALHEDAIEFGSENILSFIASLGGAENVGSADQFANLLTWYMAERVAQQEVSA